MLNNYNLFNNEKVDELTSTFLKMKYYNPDILEKYIIELLNHYNLNNYCNNVSFSNDKNYFLGLYNIRQKELLINYKMIIESLKKISEDNYFIASNTYRIILHEIKHILQHKISDSEDNELFKIFQTEFNNNNNKNSILPSEVNADIESSLVILKNYDKNHYLYEKQLTFSINLINSFFIPKSIVNYYCIENKIQLPKIDSINKFIYGIDNELIDHQKKSLLKKKM